MANESKIVAESRTLSGSAAARRMRLEGWLPAVINNEKGEGRMIRLNRHNFEMMLHKHTSENLILDVVVDAEQPKKVLIKEVQHHFVTSEAIHVDFVEISMTRKMRINIAIKLVGDPVGCSQEGGILEHPVRTVEVECLPTDLVEAIEIDVTHLKIGESFLVRDMPENPKLHVLTAGDAALALVSAPNVEEATATEGAAVGAEGGKEPELVGDKGKKEAEEAGAAGEKKAEGKKEPKADEKKDKKEKK